MYEVHYISLAMILLLSLLLSTLVEFESELGVEVEVEKEVVLRESSGSWVDKHSHAFLSDAGMCQRSDSSPFGISPR